MTQDTTRAYAALSTAIGQAALPLVLFALGFEGPGVEIEAQAAPNAAIPAGYAFSIWWLIFALAIFTAIRGLRQDQLTHPGFRRIGWGAAALYGAAMLWMLVAWFGAAIATVIVIWVMLVLAVITFLRALPFAGETAWDRAIIPGLGLYAGWLTAATFVNTADVLPLYGFAPTGLSAQSMGVAVIVAVTLVAALVLRASRGNLAYAAAVAWALVAVIANNPSLSAVTIASALALVTVGALSFAFRSVR
jgi:hypothetical protein